MFEMVRRSGYRSRIVDDAYYCFMTEDWDATLQVLRDKDKLEARCSTSLHNIGFPPLIFEANTADKFHESIASAIKSRMASSSSAVSGNMSDVHLQVQNLRRDLDCGLDQIDKRTSTYYPQWPYSKLTLFSTRSSNYSSLQERTTAMHKSILFSNAMSAEEKEQATADVGNLQMQRTEERDLEDPRAPVWGFAASRPPLCRRQFTFPTKITQSLDSSQIHIFMHECILLLTTHS